MSITSGDTQREAAALADSLTTQAAPAHSQTEQTVPVHVIQAMREELKAEKEKNEAFRNHIQMIQWNSPQQQAPQPVNPFANADPEDSVKVKDAMRLMSEFEQRTNAQLAEIKLASKTPDYRDVIQKYLPKAAQEDPEILEEIKRSPNPYKTAYLAAKASQAYQEDIVATRTPKTTVQAQKPDPDMEKAIQNAKASGNLASVGNQASVRTSHQDYKNMSDDEFRKIKAQNLYGSKRK